MIDALSSTVAGLAQSLQFRDCAEALSRDSKFLEALDAGLADIESRVSALNETLEYEEERLNQAKALAKKAMTQSTRIKFVQDHLPSRLPSAVSNENVPPQKSGAHGKAEAVPHIAYIRKEELESVPVSTRGRVTCEQVNSCVDAINATLAGKYKILHAPRSTLGEPQMKKLIVFREQDCDDIRGSPFFVEDDIKAFSSIKMDNVTKACLLVMRCVKRLRDHRSGGLHRYVLCE